MWRFKWIVAALLICLSYGSEIWAQAKKPAARSAVRPGTRASAIVGDTRLFGLHYVNWAEEMLIGGGGFEQKAPANLAGLAIQYEDLLTTRDSGWKYSVAFLTGNATGGSTTGSPPYLASFQSFIGFSAGFAYFTRVEKRIYLELGPMVIYRNLNWPSVDGITATSGSQTNYGMQANLRVRMLRNLDYCQSIGTLMSKASTIWSFGLGYRF